MFILNGDTLPKKFEPTKLNKSWVLAKKRNNKIKHQEPIGFLKDGTNEISSMFYDIGDYVWNEGVYICKRLNLKTISVKNTTTICFYLRY